MTRVLGKRRLIPHPDMTAPPIQLGVKVTRVGSDVLKIEYVVTGEVERLEIPELAIPERRDGLWRNTCFELFVQDMGSKRYHEFNFAPSRDWATYSFEIYREGMSEALLPRPSLYCEVGSQRLALDAWIDIKPLGSATKHLALTAVIEETDGTKSYWSLAHPPGKPDFHHPDCFVLELPAPSEP